MHGLDCEREKKKTQRRRTETNVHDRTGVMNLTPNIGPTTLLLPNHQHKERGGVARIAERGPRQRKERRPVLLQGRRIQKRTAVVTRRRPQAMRVMSDLFPWESQKRSNRYQPTTHLA